METQLKNYWRAYISGGAACNACFFGHHGSPVLASLVSRLSAHVIEQFCLGLFISSSFPSPSLSLFFYFFLIFVATDNLRSVCNSLCLNSRCYESNIRVSLRMVTLFNTRTLLSLSSFLLFF